MYYLQNFLFIFSLRFGCRLIAYIEIVIYGAGVYYMATTFGFVELMQSMVLIALATSGVLSILMLVSTLQEHESTGVLFTYLMWGIFSTIFLSIYYVIAFTKKTIESSAVFGGLLVGTIILKAYDMLVVLSFMHMLVTSDSEDST